MADWQKADRSKLDITYEDACIAFVCQCGESVELSDEPRRCECGRVYRYVVQLQVCDAERAA